MSGLSKWQMLTCLISNRFKMLHRNGKTRNQPGSNQYTTFGIIELSVILLNAFWISVLESPLIWSPIACQERGFKIPRRVVLAHSLYWALGDNSNSICKLGLEDTPTAPDTLYFWSISSNTMCNNSSTKKSLCHAIIISVYPSSNPNVTSHRALFHCQSSLSFPTSDRKALYNSTAATCPYMEKNHSSFFLKAPKYYFTVFEFFFSLSYLLSKKESPKTKDLSSC